MVNMSIEAYKKAVFRRQVVDSQQDQRISDILLERALMAYPNSAYVDAIPTAAVQPPSPADGTWIPYTAIFDSDFIPKDKIDACVLTLKSLNLVDVVYEGCHARRIKIKHPELLQEETTSRKVR